MNLEWLFGWFLTEKKDMYFYFILYIYIYIYIIKNELVVQIILLIHNNTLHMKSSDAKASKCHFKVCF